MNFKTITLVVSVFFSSAAIASAERTSLADLNLYFCNVDFTGGGGRHTQILATSSESALMTFLNSTLDAGHRFNIENGQIKNYAFGDGETFQVSNAFCRLSPQK